MIIPIGIKPVYVECIATANDEKPNKLNPFVKGQIYKFEDLTDVGRDYLFVMTIEGNPIMDYVYNDTFHAYKSIDGGEYVIFTDNSNHHKGIIAKFKVFQRKVL